LSLTPVSRRFAHISLLCAWLCASGAMLDLAQVFAWGRMFTSYMCCESIAEAAKETFDPAKPCAICLAVGKAREASNGHAPALPAPGAEKMVLIFDGLNEFVAMVDEDEWPVISASYAPSSIRDVPVPPPRAAEIKLLA
jgi:hypothetical protein